MFQAVIHIETFQMMGLWKVFFVYTVTGFSGVNIDVQTQSYDIWGNNKFDVSFANQWAKCVIQGCFVDATSNFG